MSKQTSDRALFAKRLLVAARLWRRKADQVLDDDCGLSHALAMPLLMLSRLGDHVRQGVIAERLGIEGPSLVRIVDLLVADGLVTRAGDPDDRRAKIISLTDSGRTSVAEIERILGAMRLDLLADISDAELEVVVDVLGRLETKLLASAAED